MFIHITPEELEGDFVNPWRLNLIKDPHIDYQTNTINGKYNNEDVIIFKFNNYGFINDNRYNSYKLSSGGAGITIQILIS
jgi:hypothetical protein